MQDTDGIARKFAKRSEDGERIRLHVTSSRMAKALLRAAEAGEAPLAAIVPELLAMFPEAVADYQVRQMIGVAVSGILKDAGYERQPGRRRIPNALPFRYASTFRRMEDAVGPSLVARVVSTFTDDEAEEASRLLRKRLGGR